MCLWVFILMTFSALALDSRFFYLRGFGPLQLDQFSVFLAWGQQVTSESSDSYIFDFHSVCTFIKTSSQGRSKQARSSWSMELVSLKTLPGNTGQCINVLEMFRVNIDKDAFIARQFC